MKVDTCQYQRLRACKQTGNVSLVFSSAEHSRFSHSLGVAHLADTWCDRLCAADGKGPEQPELMSDIEKLAVTMAGLCHDLGHGPFSHMFDHLFMRQVHGQL
mmetsp:Transcript_7906/g.12647  ORF Transcript_7906/g.12647 Transcript_7906/m.12647 type:complete len:102 (+) Transcript_7906:163-468(+)